MDQVERDWERFLVRSFDGVGRALDTLERKLKRDLENLDDLLGD
jgi:hypothetical protein